MDYLHDFCLACDKESNGPYCSQACRLADRERASPTNPSQQARLSWSSASSTSTAGYVLSPAYDFADKAGRNSYFMQQHDAASAGRALTPSSSRTSLSSTTSTAPIHATSGLSEQSRQELDNYFSSFSKAKASKRRQSTR